MFQLLKAAAAAAVATAVLLLCIISALKNSTTAKADAVPISSLSRWGRAVGNWNLRAWLKLTQ